MTPDVLVPAMFASLVVALIAGFPVAFSIAAVAAAFGGAGIVLGFFEPQFLLAMQFRILGFFQNENLLSIPLFLLMGMLLERTRIAEDVLNALDRLFGTVRGGMAYTAVLVGASIAAITGFVSASVIAIGLIALPSMLKLPGALRAQIGERRPRRGAKQRSRQASPLASSSSSSPQFTPASRRPRKRAGSASWPLWSLAWCGASWMSANSRKRWRPPASCAAACCSCSSVLLSSHWCYAA